MQHNMRMKWSFLLQHCIFARKNPIGSKMETATVHAVKPQCISVLQIVVGGFATRSLLHEQPATGVSE